MSHRLLADGVVVLHLLFIGFVIFGGLLLPRWPGLAVAHLPAVCWAALVELCGWECPLTPLETGWRQAAGQAAYDTSFVEHYLLPILYPAGLTRSIQIGLATLVIVVNLAAYGWLCRQLGRKRGSRAMPKSDR